MFRLWGKEFKDNRMLRDTVICDDTDDTRTHKIFNALDQICYEFDLSKPIWLDVTINEFKRHAKARFYQDSFVMNSNATRRRGSIRTASWIPLILIIWKYR